MFNISKSASKHLWWLGHKQQLSMGTAIFILNARSALEVGLKVEIKLSRPQLLFYRPGETGCDMIFDSNLTGHDPPGSMWLQSRAA